jgi:hypothetical protein
MRPALATVSYRKPLWPVPECKGEHVEWLNNVLKEKSVSVVKPEIAEGDGAANLAMGCDDGGRESDDVAWFNIEASEDSEVYFMNVAHGDDEDGMEEVDCIAIEEEYELWLEWQEKNRKSAIQAGRGDPRCVSFGRGVHPRNGQIRQDGSRKQIAE